MLVLLDYTKAFDRLQHNLLLAILHFIGFKDHAVELLSSYLNNRRQCVKFNGQISTVGDVNCGVPQGSILGPLLFTIYTANLISCVKHCSVHLYADDTQVYYSFDVSTAVVANNKINSDLQELINQSTAHCLSINPAKSKVLLFGRKQSRSKCIKDLNIVIDNVSLEFVNSAKNLGVEIDTDLRFSNHVTNKIKAAFVNLKMIYAHRHILDLNTKKTLCDALVLSHFNYSDVLYGPCITKFDKQRIQRMQNSCIRLICGIRRRERVTNRLKNIKWLNMEERRLLHMLVTYNNVIINKSPPYLYNKIRFRTDVHNINVRHKHFISPPLHSTAIYQRTFTFNICKWYNKLPEEIKEKSKYSFKNKIRQIIFEKGVNLQ